MLTTILFIKMIFALMKLCALLLQMKELIASVICLPAMEHGFRLRKQDYMSTLLQMINTILLHPLKMKPKVCFTLSIIFFFILNTNPFFVDLTDRVAALNTRLESILGEQMLQRSREMTFRDTSESANSRVVRWTIVQIVVLLVTCIWQLSHLQRMYQFFLIYF